MKFIMKKKYYTILLSTKVFKIELQFLKFISNLHGAYICTFCEKLVVLSIEELKKLFFYYLFFLTFLT